MAAMLPWRRSKFVLADEGGAPKAKGKVLGPGLSYGSLLYSLVRSCPDLWAEWPLERLGSVFRSRRQKVELNQEDPTYSVRYLGNAVTLQAKGEGCTDEAVDKIWAKSELGARSTKMKLTLGAPGIRMSPGERGARRPGHAYLLHRITHCAADRRRPRVFVWVYRHQVKNKAVVLRCHAVLLPKAETAGTMAARLGQTARSAFNEFKRLQRQNDARRLQQQLLGEAVIPLVPLRKLLNGKCPYRPPAERHRSAPKLSAIQEEEEGEGERRRAPGGPACGQATDSAPPSHGMRASLPTGFPGRALAGGSSDSTTPGGHDAAPNHSHGIRAGLPLRARAVAASLPLGTTDPSGHHAATGQGPEAARGRERSEVLTLTRELKVCTLRSLPAERPSREQAPQPSGWSR